MNASKLNFYCHTERVRRMLFLTSLQMTTARLPKTITAGALLATPIPPVKWIVPGLLPAGLAIFAGPSKAGKSWLTLWLCLQISQGKSVWGREIEPRTVLYFSLEDTLSRLQERLYQLVDVFTRSSCSIGHWIFGLRKNDPDAASALAGKAQGCFDCQ